MFRRSAANLAEEFTGIYNPYTGETTDFNESEGMGQYKIFEGGMFWESDKYARYRSEVENGEIAKETFADLVQCYATNLYKLEVNPDKIREDYETGARDPDSYLENLLLDELYSEMPNRMKADENISRHQDVMAKASEINAFLLPPDIDLAEHIGRSKSMIREGYMRIYASLKKLQGEVSAREFIERIVDGSALFPSREIGNGVVQKMILTISGEPLRSTYLLKTLLRTCFQNSR